MVLAILFARFTVARADTIDPVKVNYAKGKTELVTMQDGVDCYLQDPPKTLSRFPAELNGLMLTRRSWHMSSKLTIDLPAGGTAYLIMGKKSPEAMAAGFATVGEAHLKESKPDHVLDVYKITATDPRHIELNSGGYVGVLVAAQNLEIESSSGISKNPKASAQTATADLTPTTLPGPTTHPAMQQTSIHSLEVYVQPSGMMLGQTSEVTLTLTEGTTPTATTVQFVTPIGNEMTLARDETLRFIRLTYPNWYVSKAEISFEDKYNAHDGGSIGAAVGTMILSVIQGFQIDSNVAITGDISANGKVRAIGGVSAKLHGAIANKCTLVALPMENEEQLTDAVIYNGPELVTDVQVIGILTLNDAVAAVRVDRDAKLQQAIDAFSSLQASAQSNPKTFWTSKAARDGLAKVLVLAPEHLSAKLLLAMAEGKLPKTLSAGASSYYTAVAVEPMLGILKERSDARTPTHVPSAAVSAGLADLRKLRPLADPGIRPLVDAWSRFIVALSDFEEGIGSRQTLETQRQSLLDEMTKEQADADMMQKMLKEGI